ncbi:hypothetical protein D9M71_566440 [compost metagenome]
MAKRFEDRCGKRITRGKQQFFLFFPYDQLLLDEPIEVDRSFLQEVRNGLIRRGLKVLADQGELQLLGENLQ